MVVIVLRNVIEHVYMFIIIIMITIIIIRIIIIIKITRKRISRKNLLKLELRGTSERKG